MGRLIFVPQAGASGTPIADTLDLNIDGNIFLGAIVYISTIPTVALADAASYPAARAAAMFNDINPILLYHGIVEVVVAQSSPTPAVGNSVWLASTADHSTNAGKVTATVPLQNFVTPIGVVTSIAPDFLTSRRVSVFLQIQPPIKRAS